MDIIEELRREADELACIQREVQEKVNRAKEAGEEIDEHVYKWLEEAQNIGVKVTTNLRVDTKAKSTLVSKLFSCYCCRLKEPGEDALKIRTVVDDLVAQGRSIFPAQGIELIWRDGFLDFGSRKSAFIRIMESLKDEGIGIIGVSGLGGIGKTKLVTEIGKRAKDEKLFDYVLMATVTQNPDIRQIQWTLADMLNLKFKDDDDSSRANELRARLDKERSVLVILDDVWDIININSVGIFPYFNQKGCKIVITTRCDKVCQDMCCNYVVRLDVVTHVEAFALFCEYADLKDQKSNRLLTKAKIIVKECGGLPLAVVVVGSALRGKDLEDYEDALQKLSSSNFVNVESADSDIYSCLKLSYDYLDDEDTKKCFLLCSVFPEDSTIMVKDLTRYAHGQWLFQNVNSFGEARMRIFASVRKLEDASLLTHVTHVRRRKGNYFQNWPSMKMHDMVRDFAIWLAKENAAFFFVLAPSNDLQRKRMHENATALYLTKFDLDHQFPTKLKCPNLKILIVTSHISISSLEIFQDNFLEVSNALQVLDIRSYSSMNIMLPPILLENLNNLKTLCLSGEWLSRYKDMSMLGTLKNLEILELNFGLQQSILPEWIGELGNLCLLDLSRWYSLEVIPCNLLSKLTKLEELYTPFFHTRRKWDANFLSDLNFLPLLSAFAGTFVGFHSLPAGFRFGTLQMYYINCRPRILKEEGIRWTRSLGLDDINDVSIKVFEKLFPDVECLKIVGSNYIHGIDNMYPQIDDAGFQNLRELFLGEIYGMECLIDTTETGLGLSSLTTVLPNLVHLTLDNMRQLGKMLHGPAPISYLGELKKVVIIKCPRLDNIVPDMLLVESKMEVLEIKECALKHVYQLNAKNHLQPLPSPEVIELIDLYALQSLWNMPLQLEFTDKDNNVKLCKHIVRCLDSLVKMKIHNCLVLEEVFPFVELGHQESHVQLSNLVELELALLPKLKFIWKGNQQNVSLQNLERIDLEECDTLTSIFTSTLAQSLHKFQFLVINKCHALETVIMQDNQDEATTNAFSCTFPAVKKIKVESCGKLNTLLPSCFVANGLPNLESIFINDCAELERIFGNHGEENEAEEVPLVDLNNQNFDSQLPNLAELELAFLPKLRFIWSDQQQNGSLENLVHVELKNCETLTSLFTPILASSLRKLQHLVLDGCSSLESIIVQDEAMRVSYTDLQQKAFLQLKKITIICCGELKTILPVSFISQGLPRLERIYIEDCAKMENLFGDLTVDAPVEFNNQQNAQFKTLVELHLTLLPKLNCIWNDSQQNCSLQNLEFIWLQNCDGLTSVFTSCHAQSLQKLQYLHVETCQALETIVTVNDQAGGTQGSCLFELQNSFQEIKDITVKSCHKLKNVLPICFVAQDLSKLESIYVRDCIALKQIFGDQGVEDAVEGWKLMISNLKELKLVKLPNLHRFSPPNCDILIPSTSLEGEDGDTDLLNLLPRSQNKPCTWIWP
ncbi:probable disease resistance protein At4g27220 isoform X1 [Amaranthus tricolor]|uniref:probable disease resistance protein At4g27220 isoform X1 n=1 Tax=Amaranthus tricolor TaxID=29722 RepID=UPI00258C2231|nr:probable disease resistance protein At4g27220 isoform X1 [Amaranthus tricolor]